MQVYKLDVGYDRICFDLKRNINSLFRTFYLKFDSLSTEIKEIEKLVDDREILNRIDNLIYKMPEAKIDNINTMISNTIKRIGKNLEIPIDFSVSIMAHPIDFYKELNDFVLYLIQNLYLQYDIIKNMHIGLTESSTIVNLRIELIHSIGQRRIRSELEEAMSHRIQKTMNKFKAVFNEERDDNKTIFSYEILRINE